MHDLSFTRSCQTRRDYPNTIWTLTDNFSVCFEDINGLGRIVSFVPLSICDYTLSYDSDNQEFIPQGTLSDYNVTSYSVSLMWGNSGNNASQSWKEDILPFWNTAWGLDQKFGVLWKTNEICLLGNASLKTWNNQMLTFQS